MLSNMVARFIELMSQVSGTVYQGNTIALVALFAVLALGEFGVPFPFVLQGVLFFIGYQISHGALQQVIPLVLILVLGRQFGSAAVYALAHFLGNRFVDWLERPFRPVGNKMDKLKAKLGIRAPLAVAVGRLTPGLLVLTSLTSGMIGLRYDLFALGVISSALVWDGTFVIFGFISKYGLHHLQYMGLAVPHWVILGSFGIAICLWWAVGRLLLRRKAL